MKFSTAGAAAIIPIVMLAACAAKAEDRAPEQRSPEVIERLMACRGIADSTARLACYDAQTAAFETARASRDVVVVDRAQMQETRRSLFGFSLDRLNLFGKSGGDQTGDEEVNEISGKIASVSRDRDGRWVIGLEDGGRWRQIDSVTLGRSPRVGGELVIRRAALGSYRMILAGQNAFKVRRENE